MIVLASLMQAGCSNDVNGQCLSAMVRLRNEGKIQREQRKSCQFRSHPQRKERSPNISFPSKPDLLVGWLVGVRLHFQSPFPAFYLFRIAVIFLSFSRPTETSATQGRKTDLSLSRVSLHEVVRLELLLLVGDDARHLEHESRLRRVVLQPGSGGGGSGAERQS